MLLLASQTPLGGPGAPAACQELLGHPLCSMILPRTRVSLFGFVPKRWCHSFPKLAASKGVVSVSTDLSCSLIKQLYWACWAKEALQDAATLQAVALLLLPEVGREAVISVSPLILTS